MGNERSLDIWYMVFLSPHPHPHLLFQALTLPPRSLSLSPLSPLSSSASSLSYWFIYGLGRLHSRVPKHNCFISSFNMTRDLLKLHLPQEIFGPLAFVLSLFLSLYHHHHRCDLRGIPCLDGWVMDHPLPPSFSSSIYFIHQYIHVKNKFQSFPQWGICPHPLSRFLFDPPLGFIFSWSASASLE